MKKINFPWLKIEYTKEMHVWCLKNKLIVEWGSKPIPRSTWQIDYFKHLKSVSSINEEDLTAFRLKFGI